MIRALKIALWVLAIVLPYLYGAAIVTRVESMEDQLLQVQDEVGKWTARYPVSAPYASEEEMLK